MLKTCKILTDEAEVEEKNSSICNHLAAVTDTQFEKTLKERRDVRSWDGEAGRTNTGETVRRVAKSSEDRGQQKELFKTQ